MTTTRLGGDVILAADIGGTRVKSALVGVHGEIAHEQTVPVPTTGPTGIVAGLIAAWEGMLRAEPEVRCVGIGLALPGIVSAATGISHLPGKLAGMEGYPIVEELGQRFGVPAVCINDGAAATVAEWRFGAAAGHANVVGLTLGTGVGSGVIIDGRPLHELVPTGGLLLGHIAICSDGEPCLCGSRGCAETRVSANAIVGRMLAVLSRHVPSRLSASHATDPTSINVESIAAAARDGDEVATHVMDGFRRDLGVLVVNAIHAYGPDVVVLAGGVTGASDLFLDGVRNYVDRHQFPPDHPVEVRLATFADHAGVLGAAAMGLNKVFS